MKRFISVILILTTFTFLLTSCTPAETVNHNLTIKAQNFEVLRKITVYNARTDLIVLEIEGYMDISNNLSCELVVTCKVGEDQYKKNYVYLNEYVIYVVEDISGTITDPYHYKVNFYTIMPDIDIHTN